MKRWFTLFTISSFVTIGACDADGAGDVTPDTSGTDSSGTDSSGADTSGSDATVSDSGVPDTSVPDTTVGDTGVDDTAVADTAVDDTGVADTGVGDTGVGDTTDTSADPCAELACGDHGLCMAVGLTAMCVCTPGYAGDTCAACAEHYVDVASDGTCAESRCGDGFVDVDNDEDCDPGDDGTGPWCLACKLDCAVDDLDASGQPGSARPSGIDANATLTTTGCYVRYATPTTWPAAQAACDAIGLHLYSVGSAREAELVRTEVGDLTWLGLTGSSDDGLGLFWDGGEPVGYTQTIAGAPSDDYCVGADQAYWFSVGCDNETIALPYVCELTTCADGRVESNEECDDGNYLSGDGCDEDCTKSRCGNGVVAPNEDCDDGNTDDGDDCPADCMFPCAHHSGADKVTQTTVGCYALYRAGAANDAAEATCLANDMHLAKVISLAEDTAIAALIGTDLAWIGLSDAATEGDFVWRDGTTPDYVRWAGDEPNNGGGDEDCVQLYADGGRWNDAGCGGAYAFVCGAITCGNGVLDGGEVCDPSVPGTQGCAATCRLTGCGDGLVEGDETCDDTNDVSGDGCEPDCQLACAATSGASRAWSDHGICYYAFEDDNDWADSEARCQLGGAHLATIDDLAENALIMSFGLSPVLIGLNDIAVEGTWTWASGTTPSFLHWGTGEPNNAGTSEDCVQLRIDGFWNDVSCAGAASAVCELAPD